MKLMLTQNTTSISPIFGTKVSVISCTEVRAWNRPMTTPATSATTNVLTLDFGASQLDPGQTAPISAVLRDSAGQPVAGELITLFGSLGEVTPASLMSDADGHITASRYEAKGESVLGFDAPITFQDKRVGHVALGIALAANVGGFRTKKEKTTEAPVP